jgi:hypothetical protein
MGVKRFGRKTGGGRVRLPLDARINVLRGSRPGLRELCDRLLAVKHLGNAGSHPGEVERSDVFDGLDILEHVLVERFENPHGQMARVVKEINGDCVAGLRSASGTQPPWACLIEAQGQPLAGMAVWMTIYLGLLHNLLRFDGRDPFQMMGVILNLSDGELSFDDLPRASRVTLAATVGAVASWPGGKLASQLSAKQEVR